MSLPITIESAQDWIEKVPPLLLTLEDSSEILHNEEFVNYIARKLVIYYEQLENQFISFILQILSEGAEHGKFIMLKVLLNTKSLWKNLVQQNDLQPMLTELALTPDKVFTQTAVQLSQKLEEFVFFSKEKEKRQDSPIEKQESEEEVLREIETRAQGYAESGREEARMKKAKKIAAHSPKPARSVMSPPSPASYSSPAPTSLREDSPVVEEEIKGAVPEEAPDHFFEEPTHILDTLVGETTDDEESVETASSDTGDTKEPRRIFTHIHYFNRMNSRKTYPFQISLSTIAKKLKTRRMHILSGERETETQAEFELDQVTRQIMVELLISGCLVQPTFQYVDPDNLPVELTYYVTPLVEAGFSASKLEGELILKSDLGLILQKVPLQDVHIVSNRISKIAAIVGAIGGGTLPALDFLFGVSLQEALSGQLAYTAPEIAESIDIRSAITVTQIAIFILFIGFGLLWWWRKGRSRRASRERLPVSFPS
ncbi:MAG: hypothetical protein ACW99F_12295 [Candidatus Hodarchaeales archaeon]|jgi:hypothetical protein